MVILLARLMVLVLLMIVFGAIFFVMLNSTMRLLVSMEPPKKKKKKKREKTNHVSDDKVEATYGRTPMTKEVAGAVEGITLRLHRLTQDLEWLDVEARHAVQETYPADVKRLLTNYQVITDKEAVQNEVLAIFNELDRTLTQLEQIVEQRKQQTLQRDALILTTRNPKNL